MRSLAVFIVISFAANGQYNQSITTVESFGAVADGKTDDTPALNAAFAFAASHPGTRLLFSCQGVSKYCTYRVTQPLVFPPYTTLESTGPKATLLYSPSVQPSTNPPGAFQITGNGYTTLRSIGLQASSFYPPSSVLFLARLTGTAGFNEFESVSISGYARTAMVYSISSEVNTWHRVRIEHDGGGALYGFYTSGADDLGICSPTCRQSSNLSLFMSDYTILGYAGSSAPFVAIADALGGGTGDHYFRNGYIGLNQNVDSVGVELVSGNASQGGPNTVVHVSDTRTENGGYGLYFKKNLQSTIYHVHVDGYTFDSNVGTPEYFAYGDSGLTLSQSDMRSNIGTANGTTANTSIDSIQYSQIWENYGPIMVRTSANGNIFMGTGATSFTIPSTNNNFIVTPGIPTTH